MNNDPAGKKILTILNYEKWVNIPDDIKLSYTRGIYGY
jgi:hypothetical protein